MRPAPLAAKALQAARLAAMGPSDRRALDEVKVMAEQEKLGEIVEGAKRGKRVNPRNTKGGRQVLHPGRGLETPLATALEHGALSG